MSASIEIRETDADKVSVKERTEEADFERLENRAFRKAENYIIRITEKTERQDVNKLIKNKFFTERTKTADKEKLIIFSENANFFSTFFFLKSRNSERMKRI